MNEFKIKSTIKKYVLEYLIGGHQFMTFGRGGGG